MVLDLATSLVTSYQTATLSMTSLRESMKIIGRYKNNVHLSKIPMKTIHL